MSEETRCTSCGLSVSVQERSALAGNCPSCLAKGFFDSSSSSSLTPSGASPITPVTWALEEEPAAANTLGPYRLLRKIGEGGMGVVYLAEDTRSSRPVAVKILPKRLRKDEEAFRRFRREARDAIRLQHPNLVQAYESGEERGHVYYVMEYCGGESLEKRLQHEKSLPWQEAIRIAIPVARALGYAHRHGVIHRDVKPSNILVTKNGTPKLLDLGISKNTVEGEASFHTQTGVVLGTPQYLSPEQARGDKTLDGRSDLFSLGATLYHLVTGQVPFNATTLIEIVTQHLTVSIPDPRELRPDLPEPVCLLLRKMLSKSPGDRPRNATELLRDLARVLNGRPPGGKFPLRRRWAIGAAAALALAGVLMAVLRTPRTEPVPEKAPAPAPVTSKKAARPDGLVQGVDFEYYEGLWNALPDFDAMKPVKTGTSERFDITHRRMDDCFAFRFRSFLDVPRDGLYRFWTRSDDGSKLFIGAKEVVSNDGARASTERMGEIALKVGIHPLTVTYFEREGDEHLFVSWEGPGFAKQDIPAAALFRRPSPPGKSAPQVPIQVPVPVPAGEAPDLRKGLVAHYLLEDSDGRAVDSVGAANGKWVGGVVPEAGEGARSRSTRISGEKGLAYVELPRSDVFDRLTEGSYSLSVWVKSTSVPPDQGKDVQYGIIMKAGYHEGLSYDARGRVWMFHWTHHRKSDDPVVEVGPEGAAAEVGRWYHVAGVVDLDAMKVRCYLDGSGFGAPVAIPRVSVPYDYRTVPWRIGIGGPETNHMYRWQLDGNVRDLRIYNRALLSDEVRLLSGDEFRPPPSRKLPLTRKAVTSIDSDQVSDEGLVGYWKFDEAAGPTAHDSSGSGNHGQHINGPVPTADAPSLRFENPRALAFDSTKKQSVSVAHSPSLSLTGSLTLAAWVFPTRRTERQQGIVEKFTWLGIEARGGYTLRLDAQGHVNFGVFPSSGGAKGPWSVSTVPVGEWSHVAGVYDAESRVSRIYWNGKSLAEEASVPPPGESGEPLFLGADYGENRFNGLIDDVRIYRRPLQPGEIRSLAQRGGMSEAKGEGLPAKPEASTAKGDPLGKPLDLLSLVDPAKDAVKGQWAFDGKALLSSAELTESRVQIPYAPGEEYDLSVTAQREGGSNCLALILATPQAQWMAVFDGWENADRTCLWMVDQTEHNGRNSTTRTGTLLPMGKLRTIRCEVRLDGVRAWVDELKVIDWKGEPSRLSMHPAWQPPNRDTLHLGTSWGKFRITSVTLTPVSGSGKRTR